MHQRVYQPNPARANSARYWQGHGIWACQNVQTFLAHEFCWHGSKSVSRQSILTRRSTALSEAQDIQNMIPICRFNRVLCRLSLVYWGSKVFPRFSSMERFENEVAPRPPAGPEPHPLLTTALARPQVHTLGVEFHQKDVSSARVGVPIQGAIRVACHPGIANVVHLRKDRQLGFAVLHRCTWKWKEQVREKPVRQGKNEVKINDNAKSSQMQKLWKTLKISMPHCVRMKPI